MYIRSLEDDNVVHEDCDYYRAF